MAEKGLSQSALARAVGISQASIWKLTKEPAQGSKHIHVLARELGTTPAYLMGEVDDPAEGFIAPPSAAVLADELGIVGVRELDLTLGMGATYLDVPVTQRLRYFDRDWLAQHTRAAPESLIFAQGMGDSMEPTIHDADLLLIDTSQRHLNMADKIWAVAYAHCGAVKRLRPRADGGVVMGSDNPLVSDQIAYDGEMELLGRVVAIVRKM
jgi:phage repressor protein C with HTH and peptisase S24 domain